MKKIVFVLFVVLIITACSNKIVDVEVNDNVEEKKIEYLNIKNKLLEKKEYSKLEDIPCNLVASLDRTSEEELSYRVILDNPKEDMYDISALLVHNQFSEDIFPSIGIFDDKTKLIVGDSELKGIELVGYIETTKKLDNKDLVLLLWISYLDSDKNKHEIYYKVDNVSYNDNSTKNDNKE